ncbi:MAG: hypothetical protein R3264_23045, partial [Anaerolineae bacterium]|nr:hypothetical protein [Anaerolineae bacterium]
MKAKKLTEADIRRWTGPRSFSRGQTYHRQEAIVNPLQQEDTLKARCRGSSPKPYQLWVRLGPEGIEAGECTCPVG